MWLGHLLDTIETRQGEGDAFLEESVAFFRGVMHFGRRVFHLARSVFQLRMRVMQSDAVVFMAVHEMGQGECCIYCPRDGDALFHLLKEPVTDGGESVSIIEGSHVLHAAPVGENRPGLKTDHVDGITLGEQRLN